MKKTLTPAYLFEYVEKAKRNRHKFLKPYRRRFDQAKKPSTRAKIISQLIHLEPSHLCEPWISREVIGWLRDHRNCVTYLEETSVSIGKRNVPTYKQTLQMAVNAVIYNAVNKFVEETKESMKIAFIRLATDEDFLSWALPDSISEEPENMIKKRYYQFRDHIKDRSELPFPYYGHDISTEQDGDKVSISMRGRLVSMGKIHRKD